MQGWQYPIDADTTAIDVPALARMLAALTILLRQHPIFATRYRSTTIAFSCALET